MADHKIELTKQDDGWHWATIFEDWTYQGHAPTKREAKEQADAAATFHKEGR